MNKTKKALLVGTSFSAVPLYFKLKEYGLAVSVCGALENDPCHAYADYSYHIDYSIKENLLDLVQKEQFDYLIPSCNDFSYMSCAWIAEQLGFVGYDLYETALILHNKSKFRKFIEENGISAPKAINVNSSADLNHFAFKLPVLVKPVDSFSGRGVTKVFDKQNFSRAVLDALENSRNREAIIEEFIEGTLHSHSAFISDGKIAFDVFADEYCTVYPYQVNCSNVTVNLTDEIQQAVKAAIDRLIKLLNLNDGLLHTQFMVDANNFWLIESMRRCPGDLYGKMIELSTGVDYADLFIRPFINQKMPIRIEKQFHKYYARHTVSVTNSIIISSFSHMIPSKNINFVPLKNSGELLGIAPYDKFGIIFAEFENSADMANNVSKLADLVQIEAVRRSKNE